MRSWKRVKSCLVCGASRCKESDWVVYCFRYQRAFNKKTLLLEKGIGVLRDIVPERVLGQGPKKEKREEVRGKQDLFSDGIFFEH